MNCEHDSNIEREKVIKAAQKYKNYFFNTSIPNFDFPGPVVFIANPKEEQDLVVPETIPVKHLDNIMFVRLHVSPTNLSKIVFMIQHWRFFYVPIVLTFMAYYDQNPPGTIIPPREKLQHTAWDENIRILEDRSEFGRIAYQWRKRHIDSYWCPTEAFMSYVTKKMKKEGGKLVTRCGTVGSNQCKDCRNCETYYWQTKKHLAEIA